MKWFRETMHVSSTDKLAYDLLTSVLTFIVPFSVSLVPFYGYSIDYSFLCVSFPEKDLCPSSFVIFFYNTLRRAVKPVTTLCKLKLAPI